MKILALITARSGSKRLPGKNIRCLGGKPLIVWSIDAAKEIPEVCDILVSTDCTEIAKVASAAGAMVPWLRPEVLATDTATSVDVCVHALDWYQDKNGEVDGVLLLQPTSPLRSRETIMRGIEIFCKNDQRPVLGISPAKDHPMMCFRMEGETLHPFIGEKATHKRFQDLPPAYIVNGSFYLVRPGELRARQSFYSDDMVPLLMANPAEGIDIDTEWDWKMAELALRSSSR